MQEDELGGRDSSFFFGDVDVRTGNETLRVF